MAPKIIRDKTLLKIVMDSKAKHPRFSQAELRTLIRVENNITNPSELRKLGRYLTEAFYEPPHAYIEVQNEKGEWVRPPEPKGFWHWFANKNK